MANPVLVKAIKQKDNHTFSIEWSDGSILDYRLSELQKNCPCAGCKNESTGNRNPPFLDPNVRATRITSLGRYALRIQFTSGCSNGIFGFDYLHRGKGI